MEESEGSSGPSYPEDAGDVLCGGVDHIRCQDRADGKLLISETQTDFSVHTVYSKRHRKCVNHINQRQ